MANHPSVSPAIHPTVEGSDENHKIVAASSHVASNAEKDGSTPGDSDSEWEPLYANRRSSIGYYADNNDDCGGLPYPYEHPEMYRPGGYHPIDLYDFLDTQQRFEVLHKLNSARDYIEWICIDHVNLTLSTATIFAAGLTLPMDEVSKNWIALLKTGGGETGRQQMDTILDSFQINGPNGKHQCIITPLANPEVPQPLNRNERQKPGTLVDICYQVAEVLSFHHRHGRRFQGLSEAPLRIGLDQEKVIHELGSLEELYHWTGQPESVDLRRLDGRSPYPNGPCELYQKADLWSLTNACSNGKVIVNVLPDLVRPNPGDVDAGHSDLAEEATRSVRGNDGFACDIWDLGIRFISLRVGWSWEEIIKDPNGGCPTDVFDVHTIRRWLDNAKPWQFRRPRGQVVSDTSKVNVDLAEALTPEETPRVARSGCVEADPADSGSDATSNCKAHEPETVVTAKEELPPPRRSARIREKMANVSKANPPKVNTGNNPTVTAKPGSDGKEPVATSPDSPRSVTSPRKRAASVSSLEPGQKEKRCAASEKDEITQESLDRELALLENLLLRMFEPDITKRIKIEEVLKHEWFGYKYNQI